MSRTRSDEQWLSCSSHPWKFQVSLYVLGFLWNHKHPLKVSTPKQEKRRETSSSRWKILTWKLFAVRDSAFLDAMCFVDNAKQSLRNVKHNPWKNNKLDCIKIKLLLCMEKLPEVWKDKFHVGENICKPQRWQSRGSLLGGAVAVQVRSLETEEDAHSGGRTAACSGWSDVYP